VCYANNNNLRSGEAIVQNVVAVKMRPQALGQIIPAGAYLGVGQDGGKALFDLTNQLGGRAAVVLRDETPDVYKVLLGAGGYSEGSALCNCCSPFLIILSGSKSCTRPSSMSLKPS
jgi:hypothetical protein